MNRNISKYVDRFNSAYAAYARAKKSLFPIFAEAHGSLSDDDFYAFRRGLNADRSTINKMMKIVNNQFVMENLGALPESWSTLYAISLCADDLVRAWIDAGDLAPTTTLHELAVLKSEALEEGRQKKRNVRAYGISLTPVVDSISSNKLKEIEQALSVLRKFFSIEGEQIITEMIGKHSQETPIKVAA